MIKTRQERLFLLLEVNSVDVNSELLYQSTYAILDQYWRFLSLLVSGRLRVKKERKLNTAVNASSEKIFHS